MPLKTWKKDQKLNYCRRILSEIESNAKKVGEKQRIWSISHSQVLVFDEKINQYRVVALRPYAKGQAGYALLETGFASDDMRHIATCNPSIMLNLITHLREMFPELEKK